MSDSDQTDLNDLNDEPKVDELALLKQRADLLGISYSNRIGIDALKQKIAEKVAGAEPKAETKEVDENDLTEGQKAVRLRQQMQAEHMRLVRLRITNLNPNKKELRGEIFTVANRFLGIVKKFIPYGEATEDGYHVPHVIYEQLRERKFLSIRTYRDKTNGQIVVEQKWVPEFALEVLPQLTVEELKLLAAAQAAAGSIG